MMMFGQSQPQQAAPGQAAPMLATGGANVPTSTGPAPGHGTAQPGGLGMADVLSGYQSPMHQDPWAIQNSQTPGGQPSIIGSPPQSAMYQAGLSPAPSFWQQHPFSGMPGMGQGAPQPQGMFARHGFGGGMGQPQGRPMGALAALGQSAGGMRGGIGY